MHTGTGHSVVQDIQKGDVAQSVGAEGGHGRRDGEGGSGRYFALHLHGDAAGRRYKTSTGSEERSGRNTGVAVA